MSLPNKVRKPRKDCKYTAQEHAVFQQYKEEYRSQTTSKSRGHIFRSKILPDIFNYWTDNGKVMMESVEMDGRVKELGKWLANNWRPYATVIASKSTQRVNKLDIVWKTCRTKVEEELKKMLNVEDLDTSKRECFEQRTAATKRVYDRMNEVEKNEIEELVKELKDKGNEKEVQQRLATKAAFKKVKQWTEKCWLEMGVFAVTLFGYIRDDGKFVVDIYENMAAQMGVGAVPFVKLHEGPMTALQRQFGEYIRDLKQQKDQPVDMPEAATKTKETITITSDGFPVVPDIKFEEMKKKELEDLMRVYLSKHYKLASGGRTHVPFAALEANTSKFVKKQYLPTSFIIKDPRNAKKEHIQAFFSHLKDRQQQHGPEKTFRFSGYNNKDNVYCRATYEDGKATSPDNQAGPSSSQRASTRRSIRTRVYTSGRVESDKDADEVASVAGEVGGTVMVGQAEITALVEKGFPAVAPINGPSDGEPQYMVPFDLLEKLSLKETPIEEGAEKSHAPRRSQRKR